MKKKNRSSMKMFGIFTVVILTLVFMVSCSQAEPESQSSDTESESSVSTQSEDMGSKTDSSMDNGSSSMTASVVKSGTITDGQHLVSAEVKLYSDNTLELVNFNYDGAAPDVYVAIGNKSDDGEFEKLELASDIIEGEQSDATLMIKLDTTEDFNAVSIYCDEFSEDFGSTVLE